MKSSRQLDKPIAEMGEQWEEKYKNVIESDEENSETDTLTF
jgi:hypothetical protein